MCKKKKSRYYDYVLFCYIFNPFTSETWDSYYIKTAGQRDKDQKKSYNYTFAAAELWVYLWSVYWLTQIGCCISFL